MNPMLQSLSAHRGFVAYRLAKLPGGKKTDKIPFNGATGYDSNAQDQTTWLTPDVAQAYATAWAPKFKDGTGVGIVIYEGSQLFCVDIDGCVTDGVPSEFAQDIMAKFPGAYMELSQSKKGLHIFGLYKGVLPPHASKNTHKHIELYTRRRFIALTDHTLGGHVGTDCTEALTAFAAEYFPKTGGDHAGEWTVGPAEGWDFIKDDDELLAWARKYKDAKSTFGAKAPIWALLDADADTLGKIWPSTTGDAFDHSSADQALANFFAWATGHDCERIATLMQRTALKRDKWEREDYFHGTIAKACEGGAKKWPKLRASGVPAGTKVEAEEPCATDSDPRPVILLSGGKLNSYATQAEQLLADIIYVRGESLVRIGRAADVSNAPQVTDPKTGAQLWTDGSSGIKRDAAQAICIPASPGWLRRVLMERAQFWKLDKRSNDWEPRDCPKELSENIADQKSWSSFRPLVTIAPVPFLRPDMSVVEVPGYDAATGVYYEPTLVFPAILPAPTRDDALQALARLREPFAEFPFASPEGEAGFLAHIITAVLRPGLTTTPINFYTASMAASGKTLAASIPSLIAYGASAPQNPYSEKEELRKVLFSSLLAGDAALTLDNVPSGTNVDSAVLCQFATSEIHADRVLGASSRRQLPNRCTVTMTGNNITPVGDTARRAIVIRLEVKAESARGRNFRISDLRGYVRERRAQYIIDVLTIVRAYALAGYPKVAHPLESFEVWSRIVRDPLVWLGMADPVLTQATETDDGVEPLRDAFRAIATLTEGVGRAFTSAQLAPMVALSSDARPKLMEAGCIEPTESKQLGYWLRSRKGRVAGGWHLTQPREALGGVGRWQLSQII